jgi:hypothetical protein
LPIANSMILIYRKVLFGKLAPQSGQGYQSAVHPDSRMRGR